MDNHPKRLFLLVGSFKQHAALVTHIRQAGSELISG
jgi:hypothetical protein